jgi:Dyggve-Melchior-Clausen syndrome protein
MNTVLDTPFKKSEITRIYNVIKTAANIIESQFNARTASKALQILTENMDQMREAVTEKKKKTAEKEDFQFTYEEEADPEVFFVPYIWEVVVCAVTASTVEWEKNKIQVFPLLEADEVPSDVLEGADELGTSAATANVFANDLMDMV